MDLRTIKTFKTVVKMGSFNRAAEELKYAQSTVTMHIKKLESDLGVQLLERGKHLQLTEAGRLLNDKSDLLLRDFSSLQMAMRDLFHGDAGTIRLGAMEPTASFRLPEILEMFMEQYPKVQVSVQIQSSEILSKMVKTEEVDFAICTAPERDSGTFFDPLFFERMVLLCPAGHHIAGRESVYLKDLQDEKIILTTTSCPFRRNLERNLVEKGICPVYGIEVSNMLAVKYYVQAKFGIAVVPEIVASPLPEGTISRPIRDFSKGGTVGILRKTDATTYFGNAAKKLIYFLSDHLSSERSSGQMPAIL